MIPGHESSRRVVLGALSLAAVLVGCSWTRSARPRDDSVRGNNIDDALLLSAIESEHGLLSAYDHAILAYPSIAATLRVVRAHHVEHVSRLTPATPAPSGVRPSAPGGSRTASSPPMATSPPRATVGPGRSDAAVSPQAAVAALLKLERAAATSLHTQCLAASAGLAPLLASIHAAETAHADLLAPLAR
jgi:hypothetical protein